MRVSWSSLLAEVRDCEKCGLCRGRLNTVPGEGDPAADLMFIGEGPGAEEDRLGRPFVGRSGELLTRMIHAIGLERAEVYICNVVKCRPPGNRDPKPDEVLACSPFLREQIRSIWPDVIVTLGNPATHFVLKTETGITRLRGRFHQTGHFTVMPTFHPAAALRNPAWQELLEADFRMLGDWLARHPAGAGAPVQGNAASAAPSPADSPLPSIEEPR